VLQDLVFPTHVPKLFEELRTGSIEQTAAISEEGVQKVISQLLLRLKKCITCEGGHLRDVSVKIQDICSPLLNLQSFDRLLLVA
jgi:hypothetical protein